MFYVICMVTLRVLLCLCLGMFVSVYLSKDELDDDGIEKE